MTQRGAPLVVQRLRPHLPVRGREVRLPFGLALGSPIFPSSGRESWAPRAVWGPDCLLSCAVWPGRGGTLPGGRVFGSPDVHSSKRKLIFPDSTVNVRKLRALWLSATTTGTGGTSSSLSSLGSWML